MSPFKLCIAGAILVSQSAYPLDFKFGDIPLRDVETAARLVQRCEDLSPEKLVAYMLAPTWWEVAGGEFRESPSPMTLSRHDNSINFYPPGQSGPDSPHRTAFWHSGIGAWQLDDAGIGTDLGPGKFNSFDSAMLVAQVIAARYCRNSSALNVFSDWCGCASDGYCSTPDRVSCEQVVDILYHPNSTPAIERDTSTGRYGGSIPRTCRIAGLPTAFECLYVNKNLAQGYKDSWINQQHTPPLSSAFYVYIQWIENVKYEWRYWLAIDTEFDRDYAARRRYGIAARDELHWEPNPSESIGLCDVTEWRGNCDSSCSPSINTEGESISVGSSCSGGLPKVTTQAANGVGQNAATLSASVNPSGRNTNAFFEYGTNTSALNATAAQYIGLDNNSHPFVTGVANLICDTLYFFRGVATNSDGRTDGSFLTFRTGVCNPPPSECYSLAPLRIPEQGGSLPLLLPSNSPGCPSGQYLSGAQVQVSASPASDWRITGWVGTQNDSSTATVNTVSMPANNYSIAVMYDLVTQPCYALVLGRNSTEGGDLPIASPSSSPGCAFGSYQAGAQVQVTANAASGWNVSGWNGDIE